MSFDLITMANCKKCGLSIHAGYEDHAGTSAEYVYCPKCFTTDAIAYQDSKRSEFNLSEHKCYNCKTPYKKWVDIKKCPRCGGEIRVSQCYLANWNVIINTGDRMECPKCGSKRLTQEVFSDSGIKHYEYYCLDCKWSGTESKGTATWKAIHDAIEEGFINPDAKKDW